MGTEKILYKALGSDRVAIGITSLGATILAPGIVRETGQGNIWLEDHPRIFQLARSLETAGFSVVIPPDIHPWIWGKLVVNAAINPLTSILGVANGELIKDQRNRFVMDILIQEAVSVTKAHGVILPFTDPASTTAEIILKTSENISSMLRDFRRGGETEIKDINGVIVRLAEKYRIPVPANRLLLRLVLDRTQVNIDQLIKMVRLELEEYKR
jgi:2-dehydropantoate 2-reductase